MVESDEGYLGFVANASIKEILKGGMKAQWFFANPWGHKSVSVPFDTGPLML
ncbi:hypothetical protein V1283_005122 [Bradyrhizobium sp. AZCC 2262]|uniref:hypothetical protein n=1 Tax=Bradyrhizobium sp. AZCC 2262 TaxID=3117022 RepID=UPI002FEE8513